MVNRSRKEIEEKEKRHRQKIKKDRLSLDPVAKGQRAAIAMRYDIDKDVAPVILAAGRGEFAEEILRVAEDHKIPFYEDKGLADLLLKLEINTDIPAELYTLVAEILAFVFRLDQMAAKRERIISKAKEYENE
jgi:flagellar biosynthesis protein